MEWVGLAVAAVLIALSMAYVYSSAVAAPVGDKKKKEERKVVSKKKKEKAAPVVKKAASKPQKEKVEKGGKARALHSPFWGSPSNRVRCISGRPVGCNGGKRCASTRVALRKIPKHISTVQRRRWNCVSAMSWGADSRRSLWHSRSRATFSTRMRQKEG